jgi:methyltransferase (TIGR00027 family)
MVAARTRHGDEAVRRRNGLEQVVFLGSGLDMRVLRMNRLLAKTTVFELDLPEMLEERQKVIERLRRRGDASGKLPERHLIASDFLVDDLAKQLREHPAFSETAHTFVFYEGCSMYFDESDNRKILASIRSVLRHPDSRIWMDCVTPEVIGLRTQDPNIHEFVQRMELLGERFIYGPSDPEKLLADCGLVTETNVTAAAYLGSADPTMGEYRFLVAKRNVLDLHR